MQLQVLAWQVLHMDPQKLGSTRIDRPPQLGHSHKSIWVGDQGGGDTSLASRHLPLAGSCHVISASTATCELDAVAVALQFFKKN